MGMRSCFYPINNRIEVSRSWEFAQLQHDPLSTDFDIGHGVNDFDCLTREILDSRNCVAEIFSKYVG